MHVERDGYVGIADVGGGVTTVALVVPASRARELNAAFLDRWLAAHPQLAPRFARAQCVSPIQITGPFSSHARRPWAPGVALVGDAADFFDPFTGEGIYAALRGGELLSGFAIEALRASTPRNADRALAAYDQARRSEFRGKWTVEKMIGAVVGSPILMNRAARALAARRDMADLLVGVTGDFVPAREVLRAGYLFRLFLAPISPS
jgi:flavin-dependent dehydrogenase